LVHQFSTLSFIIVCLISMRK